jgi:predicted GNAT family acetyltransferase
MEFDVNRDDAAHKYYALIDGHEAHILFAPAGPNTLDFQHTRVPAGLRGRGVAEALVRNALDDVHARGERIIASCPFVQAFLTRHPEYQPLATAAAEARGSGSGASGASGA